MSPIIFMAISDVISIVVDVNFVKKCHCQDSTSQMASRSQTPESTDIKKLTQKPDLPEQNTSGRTAFRIDTKSVVGTDQDSADFV